jgi:hypothetical protein
MTLDELRKLMEADHPGATIKARDDFAEALVQMAPALIACAEALQKIAAFNDVSASQHLRLCGSYRLFDEPCSVHIAREALRRLEDVK